MMMSQETDPVTIAEEYFFFAMLEDYIKFNFINFKNFQTL